MLLLRATPSGLVVDEANGVAAALLGAEPEQLLGRPWGSGLHDDDRAGDAARVRRHPRGPARPAGCVRCASGGTSGRWVRLAASALDRPGGRRMLSVQLVDLTARAAGPGRPRARAGLHRGRPGHREHAHRGARRARQHRPLQPRGREGQRSAGRGRARCAGLGRRSGSGSATCSTPGSVPATPGLRRSRPSWRTSGRSAGGPRRTVAWSCAYLDEAEAGLHMVMTGIDVTDERLAQRLVDQVLAATTGTSIIGTNPDGIITFYNPGAERLLGWTAEEVVGKVTPAIFHDPDEMDDRSEELGLDSTFGVLVAGVAPDRRPEKRDWKYIRKDGRKITMSLTISPMTEPVRTGRGLPRGRRGRHRAAPRRGHAPGGAVQGAGGRRAAQRGRPGQDRLRVHRQPRAAHADHQRAGLHPDADARHRRRPQRAAGAAARPRREQRPAAAGPHRGPAHPVPDRGRHLLRSGSTRSTCAGWCSAAARRPRRCGTTAASSGSSSRATYPSWCPATRTSSTGR